MTGIEIPRSPARTLILTHRDAHPVVSRGMNWEFENVVREVDAVDMVSVNKRPWSRLATRLERRFSWAFPSPHRGPRTPSDPYELLYVAVHTPVDLARVQPLGRHLEMAKRSVCHVDELWLNDSQKSADMEWLRRFDFVFTACQGVVEEVGRELGRPCYFLPPSVDTFRFCPFPESRPRVIDVHFLGRRRAELHRAIQEVTLLTDRFYLYDTVQNPMVLSYEDHRQRLADLIRRTRYFVVDLANADRPEKSGGQHEIGMRFFEGAAGGAVLIGRAPQSAAFAEHFGWEDAVIPLEPQAAAVAALLAELDASPGRVERIRRANVVNSLRRHDVVYRWEEILRRVGMEPLAALHDRKRRLDQRATKVENGNAA